MSIYTKEDIIRIAEEEKVNFFNFIKNIGGNLI